MGTTIWGDLQSENEAWMKEIAEKEAASLEASLKDLVFYDDQTGKEYRYEPDAESHKRLVSLYTSFLERRMKGFGQGVGYTPDVLI